MADFEQGFAFMIHNEDPRKPPKFGVTTIDNNGARVRLGINEKAHPELTQHGYYDTMSVDDALNMAKVVYRQSYWDVIEGDMIASQLVASKVFDMAVNMGPVEAGKLFQRAVYTTVDGKVGPMTIAASNGMQPTTVLSNLIKWWHWFIDQEIANKPSDSSYRAIWISRADEISGLESV